MFNAFHNRPHPWMREFIHNIATACATFLANQNKGALALSCDVDEFIENLEDAVDTLRSTVVIRADSTRITQRSTLAFRRSFVAWESGMECSFYAEEELPVAC